MPQTENQRVNRYATVNDPERRAMIIAASGFVPSGRTESRLPAARPIRLNARANLFTPGVGSERDPETLIPRGLLGPRGRRNTRRHRRNTRKDRKSRRANRR